MVVADTWVQMIKILNLSQMGFMQVSGEFPYAYIAFMWCKHSSKFIDATLSNCRDVLLCHWYRLIRETWSNTVVKSVGMVIIQWIEIIGSQVLRECLSVSSQCDKGESLWYWLLIDACLWSKGDPLSHVKTVHFYGCSSQTRWQWVCSSCLKTWRGSLRYSRFPLRGGLLILSWLGFKSAWCQWGVH